MALLLTATFFMIHLVPGDPSAPALGPTAPAELVEQRRDGLGLDEPLPDAVRDYVRDVLHGDLGTSMVTGRGDHRDHPGAAAVDAAAGRAGVSCVAILVAIPLGVAMAALTHGGRRRSVELGFTTTAGAFASIPAFLLAVGLVWLFAVSLAGAAGRRARRPVVVRPAGRGARDRARGRAARIVRVEGLRVLDQDYMRTARGKRLPRGSSTSGMRCRTRSRRR